VLQIWFLVCMAASLVLSTHNFEDEMMAENELGNVDDSRSIGC